MSIPNDPAHEETEFTYDSSGKLIEVLRESYDLDPHPQQNMNTIASK